ncbi:MAG: thiamine-binding protein, partial [Chloroflexi bacterium]|nr:thiamine-binding protein [Chloroflexota bacterium]
MIVEIQCLANPPGPPEDRYRHIEAAIALVERSGLTFEVDALGTTVEGEPDALWALLRGVHEACLQAGADSVVTVIKVAQSRDP